MHEYNDQNENIIRLPSYELFRIRALCDEIMESLCQSKSLLELVHEDDFFSRHDTEILHHYFYALDTIINVALRAKDEICQIMDEWEKES